MVIFHCYVSLPEGIYTGPESPTFETFAQVYTDTICDYGFAKDLANYGEYSGDPPEDTVARIRDAGRHDV